MVAVKNVGIHVGTVRPHDRAELIVHPDLAKQLHISPERLEKGSPELALEVDLACRPVIEAEPNDETVKWLDGADAGCPRSRAHGSGSIVSRGRCAAALAQLVSNSPRCISAQS
jgi:hypothetical protein